MIIEIKYKGLQWDNYQGGSGKPYESRLLREVPDDIALNDVMNFAQEEMKAQTREYMIGDLILIGVVLDAV